MKQNYLQSRKKFVTLVLYILIQITTSYQDDLGAEAEENLHQSFKESADQLMNSLNRRSANSDSVDIDLLNSFDSSIYYNIEWKDRPNDFVVDEGNQSIVTLTAADLSDYHCVLPQIETKEQSLKEDAIIDPYSKIQELFTKKICIYKLDSYWTYEICLNDYIRQFYGEILEKKHNQEYYLGRFRASNLENDRQQHNKLITQLKSKKKELPKIDYGGVKVPFVYLNMDQGTICDLTNKPRSTIVFFVCDKNKEPQLESIEEVQSCEYEAIVSTNLLCDHPDFKEKKENEFQINCFRNDNDAQPIKPIGIEQYETKSSNLLSDTILDQIQEIVSNSKFRSDLDLSDSKVNSKIRTIDRSKFRRENLENREMSITAFLSATNCYMSTFKTYWTYNFCFKKSIKMYHEEVGMKTKIITLGKFDVDKHLDWLKANPDKRKTSTEAYYLFPDGDICHETNKLRFVEVKLRCSNTELKHFTMRLEEPKLCEYKLILESRLMCKVLELTDENGL